MNHVTVNNFTCPCGWRRKRLERNCQSCILHDSDLPREGHFIPQMGDHLHSRQDTHKPMSPNPYRCVVFAVFFMTDSCTYFYICSVTCRYCKYLFLFCHLHYNRDVFLVVMKKSVESNLLMSLPSISCSICLFVPHCYEDFLLIFL